MASRVGRKDKVVESESVKARSEVKALPDGKANVGYRLSVRRTDPATRAAVGDYGSIEVSVSLHEDCELGQVDATWDRLRDSVLGRVEDAFDSLGLGGEEDE